MYKRLLAPIVKVQDLLTCEQLQEVFTQYKSIYESLNKDDANKLLACLNKKSFTAITKISPVLKELAHVEYLEKDEEGSRIMTTGPWKYVIEEDLSSKKTEYTLTDELRSAVVSKKGYDHLEKKYQGSLCGFTLLPAYHLHPHQEELLHWAMGRECDETINSRDSYGVRGGIIALTMGLGKTLFGLTLAIAPSRRVFMNTDKESSQLVYPTLIVCSKSIMYEWKVNAEKFFGCSVKILYLHSDFSSSQYIEKLDREEVCKYDIVITTYDIITQTCVGNEKGKKGTSRGFLRYSEVRNKSKIIEIRERDRWTADKSTYTGTDILYGTPWRRIIIDESQKLANYKTLLYKSMMALWGDYKWCLSGTPIKNRESDIWSQLRFLGYDGHITPKKWDLERFREHNLSQCIYELNYQSPTIKELIVLPPKHIKQIAITHTGEEHEIHQIVLGAARDTMSKLVAGLVTFKSVLAIFMRLRQVSIAAHLIMAESKRNVSDLELKKENKLVSKLQEGDFGKWIADKNGTSGVHSSKIDKVMEIVKNIPSTEKILIFSAFTSCLDLVSTAISAIGIPHAMLDGSLDGKTRNQIRDRFRTDASLRILLLQYTVGSEGLNLQEANHVIFIEPTWSYTVQEQAAARCYRPGQTKPVTIYSPIVENSIEQKIIALCKDKQKIIKNFLYDENFEIEKTNLSLETMKELLGVETE